MRFAHVSNPIILFLIFEEMRRIGIARPIMDSHRVISISLNEQDWQAFIRVHPQPVLWLREQIQESLRLGSGQAIGAGDRPIAPVTAAGGASTTSATTR